MALKWEMAWHLGLLEERPLWLEHRVQAGKSQEMGLRR